MARAIEMNGIYESMHGSPGERGCVRFGGDKMALCVGHSLDAMAFARLSQADNIVSLSRPFKVWFWRVTPQPCEACALEDAA